MEQIKGAKYDDGKPRPSLVPVEAIEAIMQVREYGKAKYADAEDWRKVPREKWLDALLRHVLHIWDNPLAIDDESGLPALWHVITNAAFLCAAYKDELTDEQYKRLRDKYATSETSASSTAASSRMGVYVKADNGEWEKFAE